MWWRTFPADSPASHLRDENGAQEREDAANVAKRSQYATFLPPYAMQKWANPKRWRTGREDGISHGEEGSSIGRDEMRMRPEGFFVAYWLSRPTHAAEKWRTWFLSRQQGILRDGPGSRPSRRRSMSRTRGVGAAPEQLPPALLEPGRLGKILGDVLGQLDQRLEFHRKKAELHTAKVDFHQREKEGHVAEVERLTAHREAVTRASEATGHLKASVPALLILEHEDFGLKSRPKISKMVERLLQEQEAGTPIGSATVTRALNQLFADRIQGRFTPKQVAAVLRRMALDGRLKIVRKGGSHRETLYGLRG
jgi:hypothetical protein